MVQTLLKNSLPTISCSPIVPRGVQCPTWKNIGPSIALIPTWNDITYVLAKLSVPPKIKFPVHSHLKCMLQKVFKMTGVKLITGRLLLTGIYWYQSSNRRFINSHLFKHSYKGGLTIGLMHQWMYKQIRKLHLKLHLKKIISKIYAKSRNSN